MAARKTTTGGGLDAFFAAIERLTYREMLSAAGLLALQLEEAGAAPDREVLAQALADAAESFADAED